MNPHVLAPEAVIRLALFKSRTLINDGADVVIASLRPFSLRSCIHASSSSSNVDVPETRAAEAATKSRIKEISNFIVKTGQARADE